MKFYALPRIDGGVAVLQVVRDDDLPVDIIAKWPQRAEFTGEVHEITEADYRAMPAQGPRETWTFTAGKLGIDAAKKAQVEARPPVLTLEQRIAALEAKR